MTELKIVGLCGSLRANSTNRILLQAAQRLAPPRVRITSIADGYIAPHFNPDLEGSSLKATHWREMAAEADGLILSSPEYAAGIPGALKNALDWLVGDPRFYQKPVTIFSATNRSSRGPDALQLVLKTMSASIVKKSCIVVPLLGRSITVDELCSDSFYCHVITAAMNDFADSIAKMKRKVDSFA